MPICIFLSPSEKQVVTSINHPSVSEELLIAPVNPFDRWTKISSFLVNLNRKKQSYIVIRAFALIFMRKLHL